MKKVLKKFNRTLSIMLAAAMVLTMVPQTAMPVLAAEEAIAETDVTPEDVGETVEAPESGQNEEVTDPSDEGNSEKEEDEISDTDTEGEEPSEGDEEDGDENTGDEEEVVNPTTEEEEIISDSTMEVMTTREALPAPKITVVRGEGDDAQELKSGAKVPYGTSDIKFTIEGAEGNDLYYVQGTEPVNSKEAVESANNKYSAAVNAMVPTDVTETKITIQAIQVIPEKPATETEEAVEKQLSEIETFEIIFEAKVNRIKVDSAVASKVEVKAGISATAISTVLVADGYALDDTKDLYLTAAVIGDAAATEEVKELQYATKAATEAGGFAWTNANNADIKKAEALTGNNKGKFKIPMKDLTTDLVLNVVTGDMPKITFAADTASGTNLNMFTVNAKLANKDIAGWTAHEFGKEGANDVIAVPSGSVVKLTISATNSCALTKAVLLEDVSGAKETEITPKSGKITIDFTATANVLQNNYTVTVTATESYKGAVITDDEDEVIPETKAKIWTVDPRKTYTISAVQGGGSDFFIGGAKINPEVTGATIDAVKKVDDEGKETDENSGKYSLVLTDEPGGKAVKVDLYDTEGAKKDTITINVRPVIGKDGVTVAGVKNGKLQQVIDTDGTYAVTLKAKDSTDTLGVKMDTVGDDGEAPADFIETPTIVKNDKGVWELKIKTKVAAAQTDAAKISITNITGLTSDDDNKANAPVVTEFTLDTIEPAWAKTAPTVKQTGATDINLTLDMTLPKGADVLAADAGTKYVYKVTTNSLTDPDSLSDNDLTENKKTRYIAASTSNATTSKEIQVINKDFGKGTSAKFDVTVALEQYKASDTPGAEGVKPIVFSKEVTLKNAATKAPYYADKITLKKEKAASGVYTGQTIAVATVDFGKNTTYNRDEDVKAWVVGNENNDDADNLVSVLESGDLTVKDSKVTLVVGKNVTPGKFTIKVEQTSGSGIPAGAVPASATMDVTVVQGIKDITASSQSTIYVQAGKATSAKIATVYNGGETAAKPKTAKVGYTVGTVTTETVEGVATDTFKSGEIKGVSVKNGTVSITKDFDATTTKAFAVKVYADDYHNGDATDETRYDLVKYTIVPDKQELGEIVLVTKGDNDTYTPVAPEKDAKGKDVLSITADNAATTTVRILPKGVEPQASYVVGDFVPDNLYALTFSKKNDIELKDDALNVKKTVDKVKVTALTTDGGKQKAANTLEFSVTYELVNAKLQIKQASYENFDEGNTKTVTSTTGTILSIKAVDDDEKDFTDRLVDYKITAGKGAKIVSGAGTLEVGVQMTAGEATLNLTDMKGKNPVSYKIVNTSFALNKAPKVSLAKGEKLRAGDKNNATQPLNFTVAKLSKAPDAVINAVKVSAGTDKDSQALYKKLSGTDYDVLGLSTSSNGTFTLQFSPDLPVIKKATLYFDFYNLDKVTNDNGEPEVVETLMTQTSTAVTVKTETLKKAYKLTNKYTMSEKDRASVTLSASKPSGVTDQATQVEFKEILNANIKGTVNSFAVKKEGKYTTDGAFALDDNKLVLINPDKASKAYGENKQNNLIGFVKYTVTYDDNTTDDFITQITVNMLASDKVAVKPTATKASILNAADETTTITVKAGKDEVELVYADLVGAGDLFTLATVEDGNKGTVTLTLSTPAEKAGAQKGTLKVVLADSFYAGIVKTGVTEDSSDDEKEAYEDALAKAVIEIPVTIDVKAIGTKNKVKIGSKDPGLNFKEATADNKKYTQTISYTPVVSAKVSKIEAVYTDKNGKVLTLDWIELKQGDDANTITIIIDQVGYASYVKTGGSDLAKNKINGKAVDATVQFTYAATGAEPDQVKIKITPPTIDTTVLAMGKDKATVEITCTNGATTVAQEGELQFTATVKVGDEAVTGDNAKVTWSIVETDVKSTIDATGKLTVATDEEVGTTLTIKAEAVNYIGSATKTVEVTAKAVVED